MRAVRNFNFKENILLSIKNVNPRSVQKITTLADGSWDSKNLLLGKFSPVSFCFQLLNRLDDSLNILERRLFQEGFLSGKLECHPMMSPAIEQHKHPYFFAGLFQLNSKLYREVGLLGSFFFGGSCECSGFGVMIINVQNYSGGTISLRTFEMNIFKLRFLFQK